MGLSLSCFASHQTVSEGDKCRVIPLIRYSSYAPDTVRIKGMTMSTASARNGWGADEIGWRAVGEFMPALSFERGRMKLEESAHARRQLLSLLHYLLPTLAVVEAGSGSRGEFDLDAFIKAESETLHTLLAQREFTPVLTGDEHDAVLEKCWEYLWEGFARHCLFVLDIQNRLQPMEFTIIHEDAYQALVARYRKEPRYGEVRPDERTVIQTAFEKGQKYVADRERIGEKLDARLATFYPASMFAEALTHISETTRNLYLFREYLQEVASVVLQGKMTLDDVVTLLIRDVEGLFALGSLDDLGIPFSPVSFAACEDYSNDCGNEYLSFVAAVNEKANRSRKRAMYGEFKSFRLLCASQEDLQRVAKESDDWDCGFEIVSVTPSTYGTALEAVVDTSLDMRRFTLLLEEVNLPLMLKSLKLA
jgi:hypothetical protein